MGTVRPIVAAVVLALFAGPTPTGRAADRPDPAGPLTPAQVREMLLKDVHTKCTGQHIGLWRNGNVQNAPAAVVPQVVALAADADAGVRTRAFVVLRHLADTNTAGKTYLELAGDGANGVRDALVKGLADADPAARLAAAAAVARVFPADAATAVPAVVAQYAGARPAGAPPLADYRDWYQLQGWDAFAFSVFVAAPDAAADGLIPLLDGPPATRDRAVAALTHLDTPVVPRLAKELVGSPKENVRLGAAVVLRAIEAGSRKTYTVPALAKALKDPAFPVRFAAAESLAWLFDSRGGWPHELADSPLVDVIREGAKSADTAVAVRGVGYLRRLGHFSVSGDLLRLTRDPRPEVKFAAANGLHHAAGVRALAELLADPKTPPEMLVNSTTALGKLDAALAAPAVPALVKLFDHPTARVAVRAADAAVRIDPKLADRAVAAFLVGLKTPDAWDDAVRGLGRLGPAAAAALPVLTAETDRRHAEDVAAAVSEIRVVPELISAVRGVLVTTKTRPKKRRPRYHHEDGYIALYAARFAIDPAAANPARAWIVSELRNGGFAEWQAKRLVEIMGAEAPRLLPDLAPLLRSPDPDTRRRAAVVLKVISAVTLGTRDAE